MELIRVKKTFVNAQGETKDGYNFYLRSNGVSVPVRCVFKDDYRLFKMLSQESL